MHPLRQSWSNREVLRYLDSIIPGSDDRLTNLDELRQPDRVAVARKSLRQQLDQFLILAA